MHTKLTIEQLNRLTVEDYKTAQKTPITVVLDNVRSLNNIGSVFRTCDAFRIEKIILCGNSGTPPNAEIHKTALGAEDSVDWRYYEDTLQAVKELKRKNYVVCAVEQCENSQMLNTFTVEADKKYALIFGNEVKGVQQAVVDASDICIEIPQFGTKHSLNVAVTAGIVLWHVVGGR